MNNQPSVVILANCTHLSLARALYKSGQFSKVDSAALFSMSREAIDVLAGNLSSYDYILTITHGENFGPLETGALRQSHGAKVISLPPPLFSGLMPDMAYLRVGAGIVRASSVMGDYHSALILEEIKAGLSEADVVRRYVSGDAFERVDVLGVWRDGIENLKAREKMTDISITAYIEVSFNTGLIIDDFLSINHPSEKVINYISDEFMRLVLGVKGPGITSDEHNLYRDVYWPVHPAVSDILGIPISKKQLFKSPDRLGGGMMTREDFVRASYGYFVGSGALADFEVATPASLKLRISNAPAGQGCSTPAS